MSTKSDKGAEAAPTLEEQVAQLKAEIAALGETLRAYGKDAVSDLSAAAGVMGNEATTRAKAAMGGLMAETDKLEEKLEAHVHEKPLQSLLVAFGLGIFVSLLLRR
ncbi:MAG: hypothetical protein NTX73_03390 [Rhodobacterales bacterium]|jgi:ElaB/YqjD/DUF883 family membrane-anchored ribosome-binding protein|nr:hypothetical protein [Rhodobacterales bacterium]